MGTLKVGVDEVVEECEQKVARERARHQEALEKGRYKQRLTISTRPILNYPQAFHQSLNHYLKFNSHMLIKAN